MKRFASTRSDQWASQPGPGLAQCKVGSIDDEGIRYGLTTQALIASTIAIAPMIVTAQSIAMRQPRGRPAVRRSTGFHDRLPAGSGGGASPSGEPSGLVVGASGSITSVWSGGGSGP